jgi:hypothetical protein
MKLEYWLLGDTEAEAYGLMRVDYVDDLPLCHWYLDRDRGGWVENNGLCMFTLRAEPGVVPVDDRRAAEYAAGWGMTLDAPELPSGAPQPTSAE